MRLRYLFVLTFSLVAIIPMLLFWVWPYSKALESEVNDVKERHLVIAKNLAGAFERYYDDVTGIFPILNTYIEKKDRDPGLEKLFVSYGFKAVVLSSSTGIIKKCLFRKDNYCPPQVPSNILELVKKTIHNDKTTISTVTEDKSVKSGPILLVVKKEGKDFILGYLGTDYIVKMGKRVAFGEKGHAAVVDQEGNVLAHPLDSWIQARKNISKVSAVQKMLNGQTGVEVFYSPALKNDMIAGYTTVENASWGVMVPQPLSELENKAHEINEAAMLVLVLGIGLALIITIIVSLILISPIERLSRIIKSIENGDSITAPTLEIPKLLPLEIKELKTGFIKMMNRIEDNKKSISELAYIDVNTGLPNRNYFYKSCKRVLKEMKKTNKKAALVFIDFDEFKIVNDTYGHRVGDELLKQFAHRIMKYFSLRNKIDNSFLFDIDNLPNIIPSRIGGDEFVILFKDIKDEKEIEDILNKLFKKIFSTYTLCDDITVKLTGSSGVAIYPDNGTSSNEILKSADIAMYDAKAAGKNTIRFFNS